MHVGRKLVGSSASTLWVGETGWSSPQVQLCNAEFCSWKSLCSFWLTVWQHLLYLPLLRKRLKRSILPVQASSLEGAMTSCPDFSSLNSLSTSARSLWIARTLQYFASNVHGVHQSKSFCWQAQEFNIVQPCSTRLIKQPSNRAIDVSTLGFVFFVSESFEDFYSKPF